MPQYIKDPEGNLHPFDDDASPDDIHQQMSTMWAKKQANPPVAPTIPGAKPGGMQPFEGAPDLSMVPLSPEAERYKRMATLGGLTNNRALATAGTNLYEHDPTYQARSKAAEAAGKQAADLAKRQAAGTRIMPGIDALRKMVEEADANVWKGATGAANTVKQPTKGVVPYNPKTWLWNAPEMTPTQARAAYGMIDEERAAKSWDLQNGLIHLTDALTDQMISNAGAAGIANSDARMQVFRDMMARLAGSTTQAEALKILDTADDATRNVFALEGRRGSEKNPIPVNTPDEALKLRPGTYVRTPDGRIAPVKAQ